MINKPNSIRYERLNYPWRCWVEHRLEFGDLARFAWKFARYHKIAALFPLATLLDTLYYFVGVSVGALRRNKGWHGGNGHALLSSMSGGVFHPDEDFFHFLLSILYYNVKDNVKQKSMCMMCIVQWIKHGLLVTWIFRTTSTLPCCLDFITS
jgi:hypothetical protein